MSAVVDHESVEVAASKRRGRPRNDAIHRRILDATQAMLIEDGFSRLRLEHVAARAGVGKATIYRRWGLKKPSRRSSRELAAPHLAIADLGDTRKELLAAVENPMEAITSARPSAR